MPQEISNVLEWQQEQAEGEVLLEDYIDFLRECMERPLSLNKISREQLQTFRILNPIQVQEFLEHRMKYQKIKSIYELQTLKTWNMDQVRLMAPFVNVDEFRKAFSASFREMLREGKTESFTRLATSLQEKQGYEMEEGERDYSGSPLKIYQRLRWTYRHNVSVGATMEKDPGESLVNGQGTDFTSIHAYYAPSKRLKKLVVGDYMVQIGQGLMLFQGFAPGKSADPFLIPKVPLGLRPYTSVDEQRFMRGLATTLDFGKLELMLFSSSKNIDARLDTLENGQIVAASLSTNGLHRTETERSKRKQLNEKIIGGEIRGQFNRLKLGFALMHTRYNREIAKRKETYAIHYFAGKHFSNASVNYQWSKGNFMVNGEGAVSSTGGFGNSFIVLVSLTKQLSLSITHRIYTSKYHTNYSNAFGVNSLPQNENGLFTALRFQPNYRWSFSAYADIFVFPYLKFLIHGPSNGTEYLTEVRYRISRKDHVYFRFRTKDRLKNSRDEVEGVRPLENVNQKLFRIHYRSELKEGWIIQTRYEQTSIHRASNEPEWGWLLYQDLAYKPMKFPFQISGRMAYFQTSSYDSRLYAFEANALYVFSISPYFYKGVKSYLLLRYDCFENCSLWLRYGRIVYNDRQSFGTGPEEVSGHIKSDVLIQMRWSL